VFGEYPLNCQPTRHHITSHPAADDATTMHQKKGKIDERKQQ
jgi:hypothetical protein